MAGFLAKEATRLPQLRTDLHQTSEFDSWNELNPINDNDDDDDLHCITGQNNLQNSPFSEQIVPEMNDKSTQKSSTEMNEGDPCSFPHPQMKTSNWLMNQPSTSSNSSKRMFKREHHHHHHEMVNVCDVYTRQASLYFEECDQMMKAVTKNEQITQNEDRNQKSICCHFNEASTSNEEKPCSNLTNSIEVTIDKSDTNSSSSVSLFNFSLEKDRKRKLTDTLVSVNKKQLMSIPTSMENVKFLQRDIIKKKLEAVNRECTTSKDTHVRGTSRSPLKDNFIVNIQLDEIEQKLFNCFQYLYETAAKGLDDVPQLPQGLNCFPKTSIRLRLKTTSPGHEKKLLLQLISAGICLQSLLTSTSLNDLPSPHPHWANFSTMKLRHSFLDNLVEFIRGRNMVIVATSMSLQDLIRLSDELRNRGVACRFFMESPTWKSLDKDGVLLVTSTEPPNGRRRRIYDGILLPSGVEAWPDNICGTLKIQSDFQLPRGRTAFIDDQLMTLKARIEGIPGGNGAPVIVATCAHKVMHHADLCSGQWALLLCFCPPRESPERPNQLREILIELSKRIQHIVEASYERLTMLILTPNLYAAILHLQNVIQEEIGDRCVIEVIRSAVTKPIEEQIVALIDEYGDDFADFAFHTNNHKRNGIMEAGKQASNPYKSLIDAL